MRTQRAVLYQTQHRTEQRTHLHTERPSGIGTHDHALKMTVQVINLSSEHNLTLTTPTRNMTQIAAQITTPHTHRTKQLITQINRRTRATPLPTARNPNNICRTAPKRPHSAQRRIALRQTPQSRPDNQRTTPTPHRATRSTMVTRTHRHGTSSRETATPRSVPTPATPGKRPPAPQGVAKTQRRSAHTTPISRGGQYLTLIKREEKTEGRVIWPPARFRAI